MPEKCSKGEFYEKNTGCSGFQPLFINPRVENCNQERRQQQRLLYSKSAQIILFLLHEPVNYINVFDALNINSY